MKKFTTYFLCVLQLLFLANMKLAAQVSVTSTTTVTDAFTGFSSPAGGTAVSTGNSPTNWTLTATGNTWRGTAQTTGTSGGWYANDNLSFLGSGTASNAQGTWVLQNNTGATITGFTLAFTARMWKSGSASPSVTVSWQNSSTNSNPTAGALLNSISGLTFNDATTNISTGASMSQAVAGASIPNGDYIFIRFIHAGGSSSDNLGWDDVSFTASLATSTNYYSKSTGSLNSLATWGTNTDGSGSAPADFTTNLQVFNVRNNAAPTISADWTVSGTGSKIVVGDGTTAIDFTIPAAAKVTGTVDVANNAELTLVNTNLPTFGSLSSGSTIEYAQTSAISVLNTTNDAVTYSNLKLTGSGTKTFKGNTTTVNGNLIFDGVTIDGASANPFSTITLGGNLTYLNTVVSPVDANSITLTTNGTAAGTQTITANGNTVRWFRLQTTTANTILLSTTGGSSHLNVGNASSGGITLVDGSTLNLNGNNLTFVEVAGVAGASFSLGTTGSISATASSNFVLNRSVNSTMGTLRMSTGANTIGNLTLNHTGTTNTLTLGNTLNVTGTVTLTSGTLASGGNLVLKSSASGTASVATIGGTASITGNVVVERYIGASPRKAWRLLGANVTSGSAPTIRAAWQEGATSAASDPNPGYGTHITAADGSTTGGYDASSIAAASSIRYFDGAALQTPADLTSAKVTDNGGAYFLYVRGDRSISLATTAPAATATTLRMTGTVNQGPVTVGQPGTGAVNFSLIPNPYPSNIDFEAVRAGNGSSINTYYVWDANLGTVGAYRTIDRLDNTPTYQQTPSGGSAATDANARYIISGQAFWIPAQTSLNFTESMKVSNNPTNNPFRTALNNEELSVDLSIRQAANNYLLADGVRAKFGSAYSDGVTSEDVIKMTNFGENLGIARSGKVLSIEKRAALTTGDTIFLKLWNMSSNEYRFTINPANIGAGLEAYLEDAYLHTSKQIDLHNATNHDFAVTADAASKANNRFRIVLRAVQPIAAVAPGVKIYPNPVTGNTISLYLDNIAKGIYKVNVYNAAGQLVAATQVTYAGGAAAEQVTLPASAAKGVYRIEIKGAETRYVHNIVKP